MRLLIKNGLDEKLKENKKERSPFEQIETPIPQKTEPPSKTNRDDDELDEKNGRGR